jgi:hypothetical protein
MEKWIKYYADAFPDAKAEFEKLHDDYLKSIQHHQKVIGVQLHNARDVARFTGQRQTLTAEKILASNKALWQEKARHLAKQYLDDDKKLNEINPEIQRQVRPEKKYDQKELEQKQSGMLKQIDEEKERKTFEKQIEQKRQEYFESEGEKNPEIHLLYMVDENRDDASFFREDLKDYFEYDDAKIEAGINALRQIDSREEHQEQLQEMFNQQKQTEDDLAINRNQKRSENPYPVDEAYTQKVAVAHAQSATEIQASTEERLKQLERERRVREMLKNLDSIRQKSKDHDDSLE